MLDVLKEIEAPANDKVILLQPTSPLRSKKTLNIIKGHLNKNVNSLLTVKHTYQFEWKRNNLLNTPYITKDLDDKTCGGPYRKWFSLYEFC